MGRFRYTHRVSFDLRGLAGGCVKWVVIGVVLLVVIGLVA